MAEQSPNIVSNCLNFCARYNPDGEVIIYGDRPITWGELRTRVMKLSQALIELGVKKDDKVTFMFHNRPEFIEVNYAIQAAGAIPVPMNYRFTAREIEYQANHSDATVFIYDEPWREAVEKAAPKLETVRHFIARGETGLENALDYNEVMEKSPASDPRVGNDWSDVAVMIYTGGTTGYPKGVMLTYSAHLDMFATVLAGVLLRAAEIELSPEQLERIRGTFPMPGLNYLDKIIRTNTAQKIMNRPGTKKRLIKAFKYFFSHPGVAKINYDKTVKYMTPSMPFFHDASYQILVLALFGGNLCFVLVPEIKFEPAAVLEAVQKHQPMLMANVPTGWKKLVSCPEFDKYDVSSIRVAATGAGACAVDLKKKIFEKFPDVIILDMFGQTEMTPITSFRIDVGPETLKERSVGKSIVDVRVVDEQGRDAAVGEPGEILYRSSTVMKGYYKDEDKTREVMEGGWFKSGDLGYIDEDGEVRLIDRKKECINTGGEKVFPLEVEEIIHQRPQVEDVCIIGVPDEEWGNIIRAVVQPKEGETIEQEEIIEFCRDQLAGYKIPRSVVFVNELPLSPVGKVLRARIREMYGSPEEKE